MSLESRLAMRNGHKMGTVAHCLAGLATLAIASAPAAMAQNTRAVQVPPATAGGTASPPPMSLDAPATVQAYFSTDLYAKESGYALQVNADIGDHVKAGQVLATIDNPELRLQLLRAQAAVQQSNAALEVAKRRLIGMQADLTLQQVTLKRQEQLFAGKGVTAQQIDEQRAKQSVSNATLEVGRADISLAEANLQAAMADMQRLEALLQYTKIVAPFDGVVTKRFINPGDLVQAAISTRPATPLFTCQKIDVVRVFADVPEASATLIRQGLPAQVRLYGPAAQTINGSVTRVAASLDAATRTMRVEIDLPNRDEQLLPGMYAQVSFGPETVASDVPIR
jgi:multidrug efflux pump subunit AcrA (membrane-fusion protein)